MLYEEVTNNIIGIITLIIGINKQNFKSLKKVGLLIIITINICIHGSDFIRGFIDGFMGTARL